MDLKKIKARDGLDFLDNLVEKIPDRVSDVLKKFAMMIVGIAAVYVAVNSFQKGKEMAVQEGQDLAKDTKMLFYEEVERTHNNKKRGGIRFHSSSDHLLGDDKNRLEKSYISPSSKQSDQNMPVTPPGELMNRDAEMKPSQNSENGNLLPNDPGSIRSNEDVPKKKLKPRTDNFSVDTELNLDSDYYSKTLGESVGRSKVLQKKPKEGNLPVEDPTLLKNEIPKPEKKNRLITPKKNTNLGEILPIEN